MAGLNAKPNAKACCAGGIACMGPEAREKMVAGHQSTLDHHTNRQSLGEPAPMA
jgi:hypothetical protein